MSAANRREARTRLVAKLVVPRRIASRKVPASSA
jgi:hypothetical protein